MTWLLVTTMPSLRRMTPEPSECCSWFCASAPNICQNGSTSWRTTPFAYTLTTAGATVLTTGANDAFMPTALSGTTRGVWKPEPENLFWASWECDGEQAASRAATDKASGKRGFMVAVP